MRVKILGPLEVVAGGQAIEVGGARLRTLLIRLALDAGRAVTVESLAAALWPEDRPDDPANALQSLVSRLRRALPGEPVLRSAPGGYRLDLPPDAVDALRFERLAGEGRRALRAGETKIAAERLREALALWRAEALADVADAPFAVPVAVRLSELRLAATEDRVEAELQTGRGHPHLVAELEALTALHPLRERLRLLLVNALDADGRQAEALTAYDDYRRLLADELGVDPGPELQAAHLAVLRGGRAAEQPARATPRGNLRAPLTSFVGRSEEQARIAKQLTEGRLCTLVGPGGAGKTRLATTVAAGMTTVPGGVWLVELASVTDPGEVPHAVIAALGLREARLLDAPTTARDAVGRLAEAFSGGEALIVLDNCEHLIDAVARLVEELLGRCPGLRVLATSREPLGIGGEALCQVSPLGLPEPGATAAEALASPAVRLFAERVAAVRPDFAVTDGNVAAVSEVCRRLDGLPLAIELAAARLRSLPVEELAARLDDRFLLLTGGSRTALPRHRTLRAVVAWSWDLLDDAERRLARRLAVFPATITPQGAAHVCDLRSPTPAAVLDALTALVDKSLLQLVDGPEPRYRMLETIREYGLELLAETGEIAQVRAAHAAYVLDLAERAEPHLRGPGQLPWIARLAAERESLLAALRFARDTGDAGTAVRLGAALGLFWTMRGNHAEAASWLRLALDAPGEAPDEARTIATAFYLLNAVLSSGNAGADVAVGELRARARRADQTAARPAAALLEPALALFLGDTAGGMAAVDRRLPHPDPWAHAMLCWTRSLLAGNNSDMDGMRRDLNAAAEAFREAGERWGLATSLAYLSFAHNTLGDFDAAVVALEESIRLARELDPDDAAVMQRVWLADVRRQAGDVERARAELLELVAPGGGTSSAGYLVVARISLGNLARLGGDLEEAGRQYQAGEELLAGLPFPDPAVRAMLAKAGGNLAVARGDLEEARSRLAEALAVAVEIGDLPMVAVVGVAVARLRFAHGAARGSAEVLGAAHTLRGAPDAFNPDVIRLVQDLRAALGDRAYEVAYDHGRGLDRAGALALIQAEASRR
jgi:predicted ATPase/DNA-binding SARP family transcriptional activator